MYIFDFSKMKMLEALNFFFFFFGEREGEKTVTAAADSAFPSPGNWGDS